ncbi:hypothetical protein, partial [Actinomadura citrea]
MSGKPFWKIWANRTGSAWAGDHSVVVTGVANFGRLPATTSQSGYLHRVRQVFPGVLVEREAELAELAAFCTAAEGPTYVWWQGEAWAGKSALMASFVLAPPAGVRVVSFFITARWAGQSDRGAFLGSVVPQLSQITGESLPDVLTEAHRHEWFLRLLDDAARLCAVDGGRLVLVIDGLDEDRGVTTGPDAHSIAALLPGELSHGARVVVAGRPNPPVPSDVPDWHPLRDPGIVRPLVAVPAAVAARQAAERELLHLVDAEGLGRELLGLLTASGGGLSGRDLAELAEVSVWEVERILQTVTGRTFTGRDSTWLPEPDRLFVLAHEELQQTALHCLSGDLDNWRNRVHAWAGGYQSRGWPVGTPEYLLRGYLPMLLKVGDVERMTALATDPARLSRMLDVSGGDAAAIADITVIQEYIRDQSYPDLTSTLHLAYTRQNITQRNSNIPPNLPAAWVILGNPTRAEALAQSITSSLQRVEVLASLIEAATKVGDLDLARLLTDQAETVARSIRDPSQQANAWTSLARAVAATGDLDRAEAIARSITNPSQQAGALTSLAEAVAATGDLDRSRQLTDQTETIARSITDPSQHARALTSLAEAAAKVGDLDRARQLTDQTETIARSITDPYEQGCALSSLAEAAAKVGDLDRARLLTDQAETVARSITDPSQQAGALTSLADAIAATGDLDRAEAIARSITDPSQQARALTSLAHAIAVTGDLDRAEAIARSITDPFQQAGALTSLAEAVAATGDLDRSRLLTDQAETIARSITTSWYQQIALASLTKAVIRLCDLGRAEAVARSMATSFQKASALVSLAEAVAATGDLDRSRQLTDQAEAIARSITNPSQQARAWTSLAEAVA